MVFSHLWEQLACDFGQLIQKLAMSGAMAVWMMHYLSTASDFGVGSHHVLHSDETVAALLRHPQREMASKVLDGDSEVHLQLNHG